MSMDDERKPHEQLVELIRHALQHDAELRIKYQVEQKFRFIRDRLQKLLDHLEHQFAPENKESLIEKAEGLEEIVVYVYLYNAKGELIQNWQGMLKPHVFYEYSINRPIYAEKSHIEALLRSKPNRMHHGYLTVAIHPDDILPNVQPLDLLGNALIKIREGSLNFAKLIKFTHNGHDYVLDKEGMLSLKQD